MARDRKPRAHDDLSLTFAHEWAAIDAGADISDACPDVRRVVQAVVVTLVAGHSD